MLLFQDMTDRSRGRRGPAGWLCCAIGHGGYARDQLWIFGRDMEGHRSNIHNTLQSSRSISSAQNGCTKEGAVGILAKPWDACRGKRREMYKHTCLPVSV